MPYLPVLLRTPGRTHSLSPITHHAEEIWALLAEVGATVRSVAENLKKSKSVISDLSMLQNLEKDTWELLSVEMNACFGQDIEFYKDNLSVTADKKITPNLLKNITTLQPDHQHELVNDLIKGEINKSKFKRLGETGN